MQQVTLTAVTKAGLYSEEEPVKPDAVTVQKTGTTFTKPEKKSSEPWAHDQEFTVSGCVCVLYLKVLKISEGHLSICSSIHLSIHPTAPLGGH